MKGIILAGGKGTRLGPLTDVLSKQLLPIYDKPMVYYPLSTLLLNDIKDILIISDPKSISLYEELLGNGSDFGISIKYEIQKKPAGIAHSLLVAEEFISNEEVCLILGDNIFFNSPAFSLNCSSELAEIFAIEVNNPSDFGIVNLDENFIPQSIEEKPLNPKSNLAVTGLYRYPKDAVEIVKSLKPSKRGELEITDLNAQYLKTQRLKVNIIPTSDWYDTGQIDLLLDASLALKSLQKKSNQMLCSPHLIASKKGWIDERQIQNIIKKYSSSKYGESLMELVENEI